MVPRLIGFLECIEQLACSIPGMLEVAVYGSLVRGDYVLGCSDVDVFLVVSSFQLEAGRLAKWLEMCLWASGLEARGVDLAWCSLDELLAGSCDYKFLTVYRRDFEENRMLVCGRPVHVASTPYWDPEGRCRRLLELSRKPGMRRIVAGEAVKLLLMLEGYRGPWDKWSVLEAVREMLDGCMLELWEAYTGCGEPPGECVEEALDRLRRVCGHLGVRG